jgi:uncharacterized membrane protein YgcG
MMDNEPQLSESEAHAADALRSLVHDPSPESRTRILAAVRAATSGGRAASLTGRRVGLRRRVLMGAAAGIAVLAAGGSTAVVASADALPGGPGYSLRSVNEHIRLLFAAAPDKERLRLSFSERHLQQAKQELAGGDRADATTLLHDSSDYLQQAQAGINELGQSQRSNIENQIQSLQSEEHQVDGQLQTGDRGQQNGNGSGSSPSNGSQGAGPAGSGGGPSGGGGGASGTQPSGGDGGSKGGGSSGSSGAGVDQPSASGAPTQNS